jgi:hypothetical protein
LLCCLYSPLQCPAHSKARVVAEEVETEWRELQLDALALQRAESKGEQVLWPAFERQQRATPGVPLPPARPDRRTESLTPEVRMVHVHVHVHVHAHVLPSHRAQPL